MLTAETEAEYTTLDVLIAPTVDEKTENKIFTSIPEPYLHLLYDLYMWWPEGAHPFPSPSSLLFSCKIINLLCCHK